jgi:tetratricopeptide (TPR) repeat protein
MSLPSSAFVSRVTALWLAVGLVSSAGAKSFDDQLKQLELEIDQLVMRSGDLELQVAPGRGFITRAQATQRFQDCVYLHMIGEYALAAEGFFALATTGALGDAGLHRDAEWYLAESLFQLGNYATAEARFQIISEDESHPFRSEAVRRLLELYARTSQKDTFYRYYEREILRGRVEASDMIRYTVAKSFYQQDNLVQAKSHFLEIASDSSYYGKAQYFLGTIMVREGNLEEANRFFSALSELSVEDAESRKILDLSLLALGRIHYESGEFEQAAEFYGRIGGDSEYLDEKLFEIIWAFIKQGEFQDALRGVDIFLLAFPEHQYTSQLQLLQGHLYLQEREFISAVSSYEQVVSDYTPIMQQFGGLARSGEEGREYFKVVLGQTGARSSTEGLPGYALAMITEDDDLTKALTIYRELALQERSVEESEQIIEELTAVMDASSGIGGFGQVSYDISLNLGITEQNRWLLLEAEEMWLSQNSTGSAKRAVEDLGERRAELMMEANKAEALVENAENRLTAYEAEAQRVRVETTAALSELRQQQVELKSLKRQLQELGANDPKRSEIEAQMRLVEEDMLSAQKRLETIKLDMSRDDVIRVVEKAETDKDSMVSEGVAKLRVDYLAARRNASGEASDLKRIDKLFDDLQQCNLELRESMKRLRAMEQAELGRIRARFEHEEQEVASQRSELARTLRKAEKVSVSLTRAGFRRLEDFFGNSVMRADMGLVDVAWAKKMDIADEKRRVSKDKSELLNDLSRRFDLIKQKLRQ